MVEKCVLCRSRRPGDKLYSACRCYKKSDSNRLHKECLAAVYANKETDDLPRCPACGDAYRVSVTNTFRFTWNRVCTCRSIGHMFEIAIIFCMMACGAFTLWMFQHSPEHLKQRGGHHASDRTDGATYVIYLLFAMTMCMVPFTLKKVFERWRTANSDVELEIV